MEERRRKKYKIIASSEEDDDDRPPPSSPACDPRTKKVGLTGKTHNDEKSLLGGYENGLDDTESDAESYNTLLNQPTDPVELTKEDRRAIAEQRAEERRRRLLEGLLVREGSDEEDDEITGGRSHGNPLTEFYEAHGEALRQNGSQRHESFPSVRRGRKRRAPWLGVNATIEENWETTLSSLERGFFTSREARLLIVSPFGEADKGYKSVPLNERNNHDVYRFWKNNIETEELCGRTKPSYAGWLRVWGQYARVCVAFKKVDAKDLVKEGYFFQCFEERDYLECFLHYYRLKGQPGTVGSKAIQLNKMATAAYSYFMSIGECIAAGRVKDNIQWLARAHGSYKKSAKIRKEKERELEARTEALKFLEPEVFLKYEREARHELETIMECMDGKFNPPEAHVEKLIKKWCINFMVYLIFKGGGQRPQVYACVKCPSIARLAIMEDNAKDSGYFTMVTGTEKRPRPQNAPRFTLPKVCFKFIEYHVTHVRPYLHDIRPSIPPTAKESLLVDTRTGESLESWNITNTLKTFMKKKDPELAKTLTTMVVRSSFATISLMQYKEAVKENRTNVSREAYMTDLGALMNTSVEMLKNVYLTIDDSDYLTAAINVYKYVREDEGECEEET